MTTYEKLRTKYPGVVIFGNGGEYAVINKCWNPVRALLYRDETLAHALVRTGHCNAPKCEGLHEVVHLPSDCASDWERD